MSPNIVLIFLCLVLGVLLRRSGRFPSNAPQALNAFVIWVSMPALVLLRVPELLEGTAFGAGLLIPVSMAWIQFGLSYFLFRKLGERWAWTRAQTGALILTAGLANTAFVGLPLLESLLGSASVPIGLLVDQPGSFLVVSTVGILVASMYSSRAGGRPTRRTLARAVLTFPPFLALFMAVLWSATGEKLPSVARDVLERLAVTLVPLALIAVGFQLRVSREVMARKWRPLVLGLGFKLLLAPLTFLLLYVVCAGATDFVTRVTILEAAMAPMITSAVVAADFELDTEIANLMVGVGIPLSLVTVALWNALPIVAALH